MACTCLRQVATSSLGSKTLVLPAKSRRLCIPARVKTEFLGPALSLKACASRRVTLPSRKPVAMAEAVATTSETETVTETKTEAEVEVEVVTAEEIIPLAEDVEDEVRSSAKVKKTKGLKNIMETLHKRAIEAASEGKIIPDIRTGDIVQLRVEVPENKKRLSLLRGIVIGKQNAGIQTTFRIRRVMAGVGVEMVFPLYSPNVKEIKVVNSRKVRRAKLYYLRHKLARLSTV